MGHDARLTLGARGVAVCAGSRRAARRAADQLRGRNACDPECSTALPDGHSAGVLRRRRHRGSEPAPTGRQASGTGPGQHRHARANV